MVLVIWQIPLAFIGPETVLPILALAAGSATGVIWLWRYPSNEALKAEISTHTTQLAACERRLLETEKARDVDRAKLQICRESLAEAGVRIKSLESELDIAIAKVGTLDQDLYLAQKRIQSLVEELATAENQIRDLQDDERDHMP